MALSLALWVLELLLALSVRVHWPPEPSPPLLQVVTPTLWALALSPRLRAVALQPSLRVPELSQAVRVHFP